MGSELLYLPPTSPANGLTGYYVAPEIGAYKSTLSGTHLRERLTAPLETVCGFQPRPAEEQYLKGWDDLDYERLNLKDIAPDAERKKIGNARAGVKLLPWIRLKEIEHQGSDTDLLT